MAPLVYRPPNYHPDYPARIVNISEEDVWSSQDACRGRADQALLAQAIDAGRTGRRTRAYRLLATYHRDSLALEWDAIVGGDIPHPIWAPRQTRADVLAHKLWIGPGLHVQYGRRIDWNTPSTGSNIHSFYWILPLLHAYVASHRADEAAALRDFIDQYYAARNRFHWHGPGYHPGYTALAASIKFHHLFPVYVALAANGHLTPATTEAWMKLALGMCRALYRRETDLVLGNQTLTNAKTFGVFASVFPEFSESAAMRKRALRRIDQNLTQGFLPDGSFFERSFDYAGVSIKGAAEALRAMERHAPLPTAYRRRMSTILLNASRFLAKTFAPGYVRPGYADGTLARAPHMLDTARDFFPSDTPADLGVDRQASYHLPHGGFSVLRNGKGKQACYALFNHGRCDLWHSHMDLLNLDVWANEIPFLVEASRFGSYGEPSSRLMRMPEMHNTLVVDGQSYDERYPDGMRGTDVIWQSRRDLDIACASHQAYRGSQPVIPQAQDYRIRRSVLLIKDPGYFLIIDSAMPPGEAAAGVISQYWHSPFPFDIMAPGRACVRHDRHGMLVAADAGPWLRRTETRPDYTAAESVGELAFPERYQLRFQCWSHAAQAGTIGCITVLVPFTGTRSPSVRVRREALNVPMPDFRAERITVTLGRRQDTFEINPEKKHFRVST